MSLINKTNFLWSHKMVEMDADQQQYIHALVAVHSCTQHHLCSPEPQCTPLYVEISTTKYDTKDIDRQGVLQ